MRNVYDVEQGNAKENITALMTFSAAGHVVTPLIVFPYVRIPNDIQETVPDGFSIDKSESGWMTTDVFCDFLKNTFYADLVKKNVPFPVILFVDGHASHVSYKASKLCEQLNIILVCLYPNATRILQPADVSVFKPVKSGWHDAVLLWKRQNSEKLLTKVKFARIFKIVVDNFIKETTITNGFRTCGLYPWNPDAIDCTKCLGKNYMPTLPDTDGASLCTVTNETSVVDNNGKDFATSIMKAVDLKRFGEIVGREKLNALSEFDGIQPCTSDFKLLHSIFEEIKDANSENQIPSNVLPTTYSTVTEPILVPDASSIESIYYPEELGDSRMFDIEEVMEVDEFQDRDLNSVQTIDMEEIMTIGPEHLIVPATPKRKGKKTKAKVERNFFISSELFRMEETFKVEAKLAAEKAKEGRKDKRLENRRNRLSLLESKKKLREETKLKKAEEKEANERKRALDKEASKLKKVLEKAEKQRGKGRKKDGNIKGVAVETVSFDVDSETPPSAIGDSCNYSDNLCTKCILKVIGI